MHRLLINHADFLITVDKARNIYRDAAIGIEHDRITYVGKSSDVPEHFEGCQLIDGRGLLVLPGFIDTHIHNVQQLGRSLSDGSEGTSSLLGRLYVTESSMDSEDAYWAAKVCQLELIKAGTTCFLDPSSYYPGETAQAIADTGIRGIVSRTAFDVYKTPIGDLPANRIFRETLDEALSRSEETVATHHCTHDGRVRAWVALRILSGCSDELIRGIRRLADKYKVGIVMHGCETIDEVTAARKTYKGSSDIERLEALGVLGPNMVMIHMGWMSPREIALAQQHDFKISYVPSTSYRSALGDTAYGFFPEMAALGITISLSCNAAMSSNFLDMVRTMSLGAGAMRSTRLSPYILPPEQMVEMSTVNGAIALGLEKEIGSIEVGKKADLALFDTRKPDWRPILNPLSNLVHSARGGAHTVIVDGRILMSAGKVFSIDERATLAEGQKRGVAIARRSGLDLVTRSPWPMV